MSLAGQFCDWIVFRNWFLASITVLNSLDNAFFKYIYLNTHGHNEFCKMYNYDYNCVTFVYVILSPDLNLLFDSYYCIHVHIMIYHTVTVVSKVKCYFKSLLDMLDYQCVSFMCKCFSLQVLHQNNLMYYIDNCNVVCASQYNATFRICLL